MLPRKRRVNKELFGLIMKNGLVISGQFFVFRYLKPESQKTVFWDSLPHLACVAPKSVAKKAVDRNKLRRKTYNILRNTLILQGSGIFFYKKSGVTATTKELKDDALFLLKKVHFV